MPAYIFTLPSETQPSTGREHELAGYAEAAGKIMEEFGGRRLIAHQSMTVLEGNLDRGVVSLIEFPSKAKLMAFYESDAYRPWRELRKEIMAFDIFIAEDKG